MTTIRGTQSPLLRRALAQPTRSRPIRRPRSLRALIITRAPAPNPTAHCPSPTAPPPPPSPLPKDQQNDLFDAYLTTNESPASIATRLNISLQDFIAWHDHPNTQRILNELDRIANERAEHQRKQSAPSATQALIEILDSRHLIKNPEPARKAANKLLATPSMERPEGPKEHSRGRKPTVSTTQTAKPQRGDTPDPITFSPPIHGDTKTEHRGTNPRSINEGPERPQVRCRAGGRQPTENVSANEEPQRGDTPAPLTAPQPNPRTTSPPLAPHPQDVALMAS